MFAEKGGQLEGMETKSAFETAARLQMAERDPNMLRVPDDRRNRAEKKTAEQQVEPRATEFLSQARGERQDKHDRHDLERVGVFAEKSETHEQSAKKPERSEERRVGKERNSA